MTPRSALARVLQQEDLNFLLTNRLPRRWLTQLVGRISKCEQPWVSSPCIALLRFFADVDIGEARERRFRSLHDFFTRELRDGARPLDADPRVLVSPSDGIVGASGVVRDGQALQIKGFPYPLAELLGDPELVRYYEGARYVTLRLTAGMYHRFHAPHDLTVEHVTYFSGDTWNVNPIALKRVERLFCKNERAVIRCRLAASSELLTLVPVAAILVASMRFRFLDVPLNLRYRGANAIACAASFRRGQELGWFEHGSTIVVFAPRGYEPAGELAEGSRIRMGEALLRAPGHGGRFASAAAETAGSAQGGVVEK
jgi:phosphatidylserine decarboxylase